MKKLLVNVWKRLTLWEYWNTWVIYLSLSPFWIYFSIKNRNLFFFELTNPGIRFGGMAMQSKIDIYRLLPQELIPKTIFLTKDEASEFDVNSIDEYPVVAKPNEGLKGLGVHIINSSDELADYLQNYKFDVIIQEKINYKTELGIFYCRFPAEKDGFITGVTLKKKMASVGDGVSTVRELVMKDYRLRRQIKAIEKINSDILKRIPAKDEKIEILDIGSHTRGAEFRDVSDKFKDEAFNLLNPIASKINGFFYGRFDILCDFDEHTNTITKFKVIELNGAMSEPIHIYDPKNSLLYAWKEILRHWKIMSTIAYQNRNVKIKAMGFAESIRLIMENLQLEKKLKKDLYG